MHMMKLFHLPSSLRAICLFLVAALAVVPGASAQMTGFSAELDTIWHAEGAEDIPGFEFFGVYKVYADFTNPTDVLSAVYSDVEALGTPALGVGFTCDCFTSTAATSSSLAAINPAFFVSFPDFEYSSGWTIGLANSGESTLETQDPSFVGDIGSPYSICDGITVANGGLFVTAVLEDGLVVGPSNAVAGDDLRILVAQVTTCGHFDVQACGQVFLGGVQEDEQNFCPPMLSVMHPYVDGECVNDADEDGVCDEFEIPGCTEEDACNFDPNATENDMTCEFATAPYDCDGNCVNDADGDGICDEDEAPGCTSDSACNYDDQATDDDGSCIFPGNTCDDDNELTEGDVIQSDCVCQGYSCYDDAACNFSTDGIQDATLCSYISTYAVSGNVDPYSQTLQAYTYTNTAGSSYEWTIVGGDLLEGNGTNEISVVWNVGGPGSVCVVETNDGGCVGEEVCLLVDVNLSSIAEVLEGTLDVFPVPAQTNLHVIWNGPTIDNAFVTLRDASGRVVRVAQVSERDVLDVSNLASGAYTLDFTVPSRGTLQRRIMVQ